MDDDNRRNISNIIVSKECYKHLKIMSIDRDMTFQKLIADVLEKVASRKGKKELVLED